MDEPRRSTSHAPASVATMAVTMVTMPKEESITSSGCLNSSLPACMRAGELQQTHWRWVLGRVPLPDW